MSDAAASDVWLWSCHGPADAQGNRQTISTAPQTVVTGDGAAAKVNGGCGGGSDAVSLTKGNPAAKSSAQLSVPDAPVVSNPGGPVPPTVLDGLNIKKIRVIRHTTGLATAPADQTYALTFNGQTLETSAALSADDATYDVNSGSGPLIFKLTCVDTCAAVPSAVGVDVVAVAFLVSDNEGPYGAGVGRNNPVVSNASTNVGAGQPLRPSASDSGAGLEYAEVTITNLDGSGPRSFRSSFGTDGGCTELSPADGTNDRPLDATRCPRSRATSDLRVDWDSFAAGSYKRSVMVYDAAGNASPALVDEQFEIVHPAPVSSTATLSIGSSGVATTTPAPGTPAGGGVQGATQSSCNSPRLSVTLSSKPVRISKGVPVLQYKKNYRFKGRLTCVVNRKRQSALKGTKISIFNKVGKKTVSKPRTAVRAKGAVDLKLKFLSSRTVIFRFTSATGKKSEVKIKIRITKKKATKR